MERPGRIARRVDGVGELDREVAFDLDNFPSGYRHNLLPGRNKQLSVQPRID
jgi:hypothetical protein